MGQRKSISLYRGFIVLIPKKTFVYRPLHMFTVHSLPDHDECKNGRHTCSQICGNTPGSYYCTCRPGYYLDGDLRTCKGNISVDIQTEKSPTSLLWSLLDRLLQEARQNHFPENSFDRRFQGSICF